MKKKLFGILAILALIFSIAACGNNNDNNNANKDNDTNKTTDTASAGDAAKLFDQSCSQCHGKNLEGAVGPNLTKVGSKYSKDEILDIIKNGKSGGMPAGQLKGGDAETVAAWLSEKK